MSFTPQHATIEVSTELEVIADSTLESLACDNEPPIPVFESVRFFMDAAGHTQPDNQDENFNLYCDFVEEEYKEVQEALAEGDPGNVLKELFDLVWVTVGAIHAMGVDPQQVWTAGAISNLTKIDPDKGVLRRREDGKVLKPEGWKKPDFSIFFEPETE